MYTKINPLIYNFSWGQHSTAPFFNILHGALSRDICVDLDLFFGKWVGTSIYTLSFMVILQFIVPLKLN